MENPQAVVKQFKDCIEAASAARQPVRLRGGGTKDAGKVHGSKGKHRIHKKRGGSVGADSHPFSSAYSAKTEAK